MTSQLALVFFISALVFYVVATLSYFAHLLSKKTPLSTYAVRLLVVAVILHAVGQVVRVVALGTLPAVSVLEASNLLAMVMAIVFLYVARRYNVPVLGAFAAPLCVVTVGASLAFGSMTGVVPDALETAWFPVHLTLVLTADALFLIAGIAAATWLLQERLLRKKQITGGLFKKLPSLYVLDEITHRFIVVGWLLMTMGMVAGMFLAKQKWGAYWSFDPRQDWSLMVWLLFTANMHARLIVGWRGRRAAWLTVGTVFLIFVGLFGLDVFTNTRHTGQYR